MENKDKEVSLFQHQLREKAVLKGKNPETIFALSEKDSIDIHGILKVLSYDGAEIVAQTLDSFIFDFLLVLSQSGENEITIRMQNQMWLIKRLRDAILHGMPHGLPLGYSDRKDATFTI